MKFPCLWKAGGPKKYIWGFGYWSSGPESLPGDGLLTYKNLEGYPEKTREKNLVKLVDAPTVAIFKWINHSLRKRANNEES